MCQCSCDFEVNQTKGGCQSGRKVVPYNSKSDLPLGKIYQTDDSAPLQFFNIFNPIFYRERDGNVLKERIENERKEMQILIDKDRDDTNKKLKEEHDQRRIEQMELVQRLDNNEKCGKSDITVSNQPSKFLNRQA